jgi:hypothetical protein
LVSTFFTLTSDQVALQRRNLFKQIHEIVFHGQGGYKWADVYSMPIWLRQWTYNEINTYYQEQNKQAEQANHPKNSLVNSDGKVNVKAFQQASKPYKSSYK